MTTVLFIIGAVLAVVLLVLLVFTLLLPPFRIWPTPGSGSWQGYVFWPLFRSLNVLCFAVAITTHANYLGLPMWLRLVAFALLVFSIALFIYSFRILGKDNSYGAQDGLVTILDLSGWIPLWNDSAETRDSAFDNVRMLICDDASLRDPGIELHRSKLRRGLIAEAVMHSGTGLAHEALCHAASVLVNRDEDLPPWLGRYLIFVATGKPSKRGRRSKDTSARDLAIASVADGISRRYSLFPTRNVATTTESGCSIVVEALKRLDIEMSESNVNDIWGRVAPHLDELLDELRAAAPTIWTLATRWRQLAGPLGSKGGAYTLADLLLGRLEAPR